MDYLRFWARKNGESNRVFLLGEDRDVWLNTPLCDLVALHARQYEDAISSWITTKALLWYHKALGYRSKRVCSAIVSEIRLKCSHILANSRWNFWHVYLSLRSKATLANRHFSSHRYCIFDAHLIHRPAQRHTKH